MLVAAAVGVFEAVYTPVKTVVEPSEAVSDPLWPRALLLMGCPGTPAATLELGRVTELSSW